MAAGPGTAGEPLLPTGSVGRRGAAVRAAVSLAALAVCAGLVLVATQWGGGGRPTAAGLLEACGEGCLKDQIAQMYRSTALDPAEARYLPAQVSAERWPTGTAPAGEEREAWPAPGAQLSPNGEVSAPPGSAGAGGGGGGGPQAVLDVASVDPELLVAAQEAGQEAARRALPLAPYEPGPGEYDPIRDPLFQEIDAMGRGPSLDGIVDAGGGEEPEEEVDESPKEEEADKEEEEEEEEAGEEEAGEEEENKDEGDKKAEDPSQPETPGPPAFSRSSSAGFDFHFFPKNKPPPRDPSVDNPFAFGVEDEPIVATYPPQHPAPFSNAPLGKQRFGPSGDPLPERAPIVFHA